MPRPEPGIITVRPFEERDLDAASDLCDRARAADPGIEPFSQRLAIIATGPRALLPLWRVAEGEDFALHGISFAALREARNPAATARLDPASAGPRNPPEPRTSVEVYAAVMPALRRLGLGRQLFEPALAWADAQAAEGAVTLRARVRDPGVKAGQPAPLAAANTVRPAPDRPRPLQASAGQAFLCALGFELLSAQLQLTRQGPRPPAPRELPQLVLRVLDHKDASAVRDFERLSNDAWASAEETFPSRADELAQLIAELDRLILLARLDGKPAGYLSAVRLGRALGIEEIAVLPALRRYGIGRELVAEALRREPAAAAVLTVSETNRPARALYKSLGFIQSGRRLIFERASAGTGPAR